MDPFREQPRVEIVRHPDDRDEPAGSYSTKLDDGSYPGVYEPVETAILAALKFIDAHFVNQVDKWGPKLRAVSRRYPSAEFWTGRELPEKRVRNYPSDGSETTRKTGKELPPLPLLRLPLED